MSSASAESTVLTAPLLSSSDEETDASRHGFRFFAARSIVERTASIRGQRQHSPQRRAHSAPSDQGNCFSRLSIFAFV